MLYEVKDAPKRRNGKPDGRRIVFRTVDGQEDVPVASFLAKGFAKRVASSLSTGKISEAEAKALESSTLKEIARRTAEQVSSHLKTVRHDDDAAQLA